MWRTIHNQPSMFKYIYYMNAVGFNPSEYLTLISKLKLQFLNITSAAYGKMYMVQGMNDQVMSDNLSITC